MTLPIRPKPEPSALYLKQSTSTVKLKPIPLPQKPSPLISLTAPKHSGSVVGLTRTRGRYCEACRHPQCNDINLALLSGETLRSIAQRTGLSHSSISRHKHNCLPQDLLQARLSKNLLDSDFLLAKASKLFRAVEQALEKAQQTGTTSSVLAAAREIRPTLELLAKFSTQSKTTTEQPDIRITAEFSGLRTAILAALSLIPRPVLPSRLHCQCKLKRRNEFENASEARAAVPSPAAFGVHRP